MNSHSVVPIGGAPFIRPYSNARAIDTSSNSAQTHLSHPSSCSPEQSPNFHWNTVLPSHDGNSTPSSATSSPSNISSSSFSPSSSSPQLEAALRYSSAVHQHTRNMWEKERSSIEKLKFEASIHHTEDSSLSTSSSSTSSAADRRRSVDNSTHTRRSSLGSSLGVEHLFGRKKRQQNPKSIY